MTASPFLGAVHVHWHGSSSACMCFAHSAPSGLHPGVAPAWLHGAAEQATPMNLSLAMSAFSLVSALAAKAVWLATTISLNGKLAVSEWRTASSSMEVIAFSITIPTSMAISASFMAIGISRLP